MKLEKLENFTISIFSKGNTIEFYPNFDIYYIDFTLKCLKLKREKYDNVIIG